MRKEIVCYVSTNEEGEELSVQRVANDPDFLMLRLGEFRLAINKMELVEAVDTLQYYGTLFDQEKIAKDNRKKRDAAKAKSSKEEEGTIIMDQELRTGPTASEQALEKMMANLSDGTTVKEQV